MATTPPSQTPTPSQTGSLGTMLEWFNPFSYRPIQSTGGSLASGVEEKIREALQKNGALYSQQIDLIVSHALLRSPPKELLEIKNLCGRLVSSSHQGHEKKDVEALKTLLQPLDQNFIENISKTLCDETGKSTPLSPEEKNAFLSLLKNLSDQVQDDSSNPLYVKIEKPLLDQLAATARLFELVIRSNQGVIVKALEVLHQKGAHVASETLSNNINALPHKHLTKAKILVQLLGEALKNKDCPEENLQIIMKDLHENLTILENKRVKIFKKNPLSENELLGIETFKTLLSDYITPISGNLVTKEQIKQALKTQLKPIIFGHFDSEQGVMGRTMDVFLQTLTPILARLEKLPQTWLQNIFAPTPSTLPSSTTSTPPPPLSPSTVSLSEYLGKGSQVLSSLTSAAMNLFSQKAVAPIAQGLVWALKSAQNITRDKEPYKDLHQTITNTIREAETAINAGAWKTFLEVINRCLGTLNAHQIYLNGIRIPRLGGTSEAHFQAIPLYSQNLKVLNKAPGAPLHKEDYQKLIDLEKQAFDKNTSFFIALKVVYESSFLCGMKIPDDNFYYNLMEKAGEVASSDQNQKMRELFFAHLDEIHQKGKISSFTKLLSKGVFSFLCPMSHFFTKFFSKDFIQDLQSTIKDNLKHVMKQSAVNLNRYLEILNSAYERVAKNPVMTHTLTEMLEKELQSPACNLNYPPEKIYQEVAHQFINRYSINMNWRHDLGTWIDKKKPLPSNLSKKCVVFLFNTCSLTLKALLYIPEKLVNFCLNASIKKILVSNEIIDRLVEKSTSSLKDPNGYTHALNSVLYEQMQRILEIMKKAFAEKNPHFSIGDDASLEQHEEFTALIKNLFSILRKDKCSIKQELVNVLKNDSLSQKVRDAVDDYIVKDTVEAAARLIKIALDSILEKDQIELHILNFFSMVNRTYKAGKPVSTHEFKAMEQAINSLSDEIITVALEKSLNEKLDFSIDKQTKDAKEAVIEIKKTSSEFLTNSSRTLREIESYVAWDHWKSLAEFEKVKQSSVEFQQKKVNVLFKSFCNLDLDVGTKSRLDEYHADLARQCKDLDTHLIRLHALQTKINLHQKTNQDLIEFEREVEQMTALITSPILRDDQISECNQIMKKTDKILREFPKIDKLNPCLKTLEQQLSLIQQAWYSLQESRQTISQLSPDLVSSTALLEQLKTEKKLSFSTTSTQLSALSSRLIQKINGIHSTTHKGQLLKALQEFNTVTNEEGLNSRYHSLKTTIETVWISELGNLEHLRSHINTCKQIIKKTITDSHEIDPHYIPKQVGKIRHSMGQTHLQIEKMQHWVHELKDIPMLNISLSDMAWLKDYAQSFAYSYVKKEVEGFIHFIRRPHNTRYGIFHHSVFLPFIRGSTNSKK